MVDAAECRRLLGCLGHFVRQQCTELPTRTVIFCNKVYLINEKKVAPFKCAGAQAIIVRAASSCRAAAEDITLEAYRLGSTDNISAVVFEVNASGPWSRSARVGAAVRSFSNRGVKPKAAAAAGGRSGAASAAPPAATQGALTAEGLPHGITTTVGHRNNKRSAKVPPALVHVPWLRAYDPTARLAAADAGNAEILCSLPVFLAVLQFLSFFPFFLGCITAALVHMGC